MAAPLTLEDVARLLARPSPDLRAELAESVAANLSGPGLAPGEVALAREIVRILANDVETTVRAALSRALRHSPDLPHEVALRLASDIDAVALPLLADSVVLTDDDLVEMVRRGTQRKQVTIAGRPNLAETVSDALIVHAGEPAVAALMGNNSAGIKEESYDRAMTRFAGSERVKEAMVLRHSLPATVSERLVTLVSLELQERLLKSHALSPGLASDIVLRSREHAIIHLSAGSSEQDLRQLVAQLNHGGRLTPTLLFRALCMGDIAFFEAAMAEKVNIPVANAQILIHEPSGRGFAALYRKAEMPPAMFDALRSAIQVVDETGFDGGERDLERFRARVITRVLTLAEAIDGDVADYLIDKLGSVLAGAHEAPLPSSTGA
ncbi:MAG: DUF2336 domain-containing protein [Acetobacteraceae bacterium]|nr:DUF2336 domain-containing protein [Acetobacteraceae bacterium]